MEEPLKNAQITTKNHKIWSRHIALPQDHGAWVFLFSPLLIGIFAGNRLSLATFFLVIAVISAFLIRQPVTILVKAYSARRSRRDIPIARFWILVYSLIGFAALVGLISQGYIFLLILAIPGAPVFAWHLFLVSRRAERRQLGVELVGTGVLALAAPAGYWIGTGTYDLIGWWLFFLTWFQSAASIVYAYLRLEQRRLKEKPNLPSRFIMGWRALLYALFNFVGVLSLSLTGMLPFWLFIPYLLQLAETTQGTLNPAVQFKPTRIGIRQLVVSSLFTILFIVTWNLHA